MRLTTKCQKCTTVEQGGLAAVVSDIIVRDQASYVRNSQSALEIGAHILIRRCPIYIGILRTFFWRDGADRRQSMLPREYRFISSIA